jgi:hypothetical protein
MDEDVILSANKKNALFIERIFNHLLKLLDMYLMKLRLQ